MDENNQHWTDLIDACIIGVDDFPYSFICAGSIAFPNEIGFSIEPETMIHN